MTMCSWTALCLMAFFALSLVGAVRDIKVRKVPNALFAGMACTWVIWRIGCMLIGGASGSAMAADEAWRSAMLLAQGTIAYASMLACVHVVERVTLRFAMGGADLKFIAACTAFLGWDTALPIIAIGCIVGILYPLASSMAKEPTRGIPLVASIASLLPLAGLVA